MADLPAVPTLTTWAQECVQGLFAAVTRDDFDNAFDALVAAHATIAVNGETVSRAHYKRLLRSETANDVSAEVSFAGTVEVNQNPEALVPVGDVGLFFEALIRPELALSSSKVTGSIILVVENIETMPGKFDGRQATGINYIVSDVPSAVE